MRFNEGIAVSVIQKTRTIMIENMFVVKRTGAKEDVAFEKVQERISKASTDLTVNVTKVAQGVLTRIVDGITTTELDTIAANLAFSWSTSHPDYGILAARIAISNHQKNTPATFLDCVNRLDAVLDRSGNPASLLHPDFVAVVRTHAETIERRIDYSRDFLLDYFGFKTLERAYLLRDTKRVVVERPQYLWMRVAIGLWLNDLEKAFETYDMISQKFYTHATPTLFNAGTKRPQLSSCFLIAMKADSIKGVYDTLQDCALISQYGGGIGLHLSNIRAEGSLIRGTGGVSNGIVPMMRVFNNTARYVDQCFTPETRIFTRDGVKPICDVGVSDQVLCSDGEYHKVRLPIRHEIQGTMLKFQLRGLRGPVKVTHEHPLLGFHTIASTHQIPHLEYIDAKQYHVGDCLAFRVPTFEDDDGYFTEEDCRMYGIITERGAALSSSVELILDTEQHQNALYFVHDYLNRRGIRFTEVIHPDKNIATFRWSVANPGWKFTSAQIRSGIHTRFLHLSLPKIRQIVSAVEEVRHVPSDSDELFYMKLRLRKQQEYVWVPIEQIEETVYGGVVHDFEVESPHDYTVVGLGLAHNGGGKRNGSFAMYLEPWHADVEAFLEMKKNTGSEEERARDLFYALWIPDLFMERVDKNEDWTLFCPNEAPGLADAVGDDFRVLYERYEAEGRGRKTVKAQTLWFHILDSQIETGTPYLLYKDAANLKSNQKNLGTIKSSNLCVAPETKILTREGEFTIKDLVGQKVDVWNGDRWSSVTVNQTGASQPLLSVHVECIRFSLETNTTDVSTQVLECTPYHKFLLEGHSIKKAIRVEARELNAGQALMSWHSPQTSEVIGYRVIKVENNGRIDDTYCFNEPLNHAGIFNGILTGNCTEIIEYSSPTETAVCNLASLSLPAFVKNNNTEFDFPLFRKVVRAATRNLNKVIDRTFYPIPEAQNSNEKHRPIGLGVQGLSDVFAMMNLAWESEEAATLNKRIFAHLYYAALEESCLIAAKEGAYKSFAGSPASKGELQFHLWNTEPLQDEGLDWDQLIHSIQRIGLRNSLLVAPMPTASTSQILGNCECFEPYATHIFTRRTLAGEFIVINKHLVKALLERGLWSDAMKNRIIGNNGSVQGLAEVPEEIQRVFKTVWEIKQKTLIDMAADRGPYICQSQSLNLFLGDPDYRKLTSMHFYAWRKGLKTGIYYLRTRAVASAQKFTVEPATKPSGASEQTAEPAECLMCSS